MNTTTKDIDTENTQEKFVQGFEGNPFARISCRNIANKMCSGTCGNCKKERDMFKMGKLAELEKRNIHGDPDFEDIHGTPEEVWNSWINRIQNEKMKFWERRSAVRDLARETVKDITIITLQ